jgi:hypothetical protein
MPAAAAARRYENLNPDHLATIIGVLDSGGDGQQIAVVWIAKEHLRALLAPRATRTHVTPAPSAVRDKLAAFYLWCADHHDIPEIKTLAATIEKWQQPVITRCSPAIRTRKQKRIIAPRQWSPGTHADSPTQAIRPAVSAWPPPEPPGRLVSAVPGGGHGK